MKILDSRLRGNDKGGVIARKDNINLIAAGWNMLFLKRGLFE